MSKKNNPLVPKPNKRLKKLKSESPYDFEENEDEDMQDVGQPQPQTEPKKVYNTRAQKRKQLEAINENNNKEDSNIIGSDSSYDESKLDIPSLPGPNTVSTQPPNRKRRLNTGSIIETVPHPSRPNRYIERDRKQLIYTSEGHENDLKYLQAKYPDYIAKRAPRNDKGMITYALRPKDSNNPNDDLLFNFRDPEHDNNPIQIRRPDQPFPNFVDYNYERLEKTMINKYNPTTGMLTFPKYPEGIEMEVFTMTPKEHMKNERRTLTYAEPKGYPTYLEMQSLYDRNRKEYLRRLRDQGLYPQGLINTPLNAAQMENNNNEIIPPQLDNEQQTNLTAPSNQSNQINNDNNK